MEKNWILVNSNNGDITDLNDKSNRDNCNYPYFLLKNEINKLGFLKTSNHKIANLKIYIDNIADSYDENSYILLMENHKIYSRNQVELPKNIRNNVFSWSDDLVKLYGYNKIFLPNKIEIPVADGGENRDVFCVMLAGNKAIDNENELYSKRVEIIDWFENNQPDRFELYGSGWDTTAYKKGLINKIHRKLLLDSISKIYYKKKVYKGYALTKRKVLGRAKYAFAFENFKNIDGYITEKIFDCFFSGCVPIYFGDQKIQDHIPFNCYIDYRKFSGMNELYKFLNNIDNNSYLEYQKNIILFLESMSSYKFSAEYFCASILKKIKKDFSIV